MRMICLFRVSFPSNIKTPDFTFLGVKIGCLLCKTLIFNVYCGEREAEEPDEEEDSSDDDSDDDDGDGCLSGCLSDLFVFAAILLAPWLAF